MRYLILLLIGQVLLFSPKSDYQQSDAVQESELEVLKDIILTDSIPTVYFKTIVSDINQPLSRHLFYLDRFEICNALMSLDSMILDKEERSYLVDRFTTMKSGNINKLIKDPKNHSVKELKGHDWTVISLPVVFRDGEFAIYYSKGAYSGQFILMENIEGQWQDVCYSSVWN